MRRGLAPSSHVDGLLPVTGEHSENKVVMKWGDLDVNWAQLLPRFAPSYHDLGSFDNQV